ncbi:MAG: ParB N-terminal domain-containing protein [Bacillota bacterium]
MAPNKTRPAAQADPGVPVTTVRVDDLVLDDARFHVRDALDEPTVEHYRTILNRLPPILVARLGKQLVLLDGRHRVEAASREGRRELPAVVKDLDEREALREAIRANARNGLPLTLDERKRAAERLLKAFPEASDRSVAHDVGLSDKTVGAIRQDLERTAEIPRLPVRVGRDRKVRRVIQRECPAPARLRRHSQPEPSDELSASALEPAEGTTAEQEPEDAARPAAATPEAGATVPPTRHREPTPLQAGVKEVPGEERIPVTLEVEEPRAEEPATASMGVGSASELAESRPGDAAASVELLRAAARWLQAAAEALAGVGEDADLRAAIEQAAQAALELWEAVKRRLDLKAQRPLRDDHIQPLRRHLGGWKAAASSD